MTSLAKLLKLRIQFVQRKAFGDDSMTRIGQGRTFRYHPIAVGTAPLRPIRRPCQAAASEQAEQKQVPPDATRPTENWFLIPLNHGGMLRKRHGPVN